jgi:hypothetical protein
MYYANGKNKGWHLLFDNRDILETQLQFLRALAKNHFISNPFLP